MQMAAAADKPVFYDTLAVLSERLLLPELMDVAKKLTVNQVALMDVIEAESFGISREGDWVA